MALGADEAEYLDPGRVHLRDNGGIRGGSRQAVGPRAWRRPDRRGDHAAFGAQGGTGQASANCEGQGALPLGLMLIGADGRPPQQTQAEALRRYLEFMQEETGEKQQSRQDDPAGDEREGDDELAAILDQFIQGS